MKWYFRLKKIYLSKNATAVIVNPQLNPVKYTSGEKIKLLLTSNKILKKEVYYDDAQGIVNTISVFISLITITVIIMHVIYKRTIF